MRFELPHQKHAIHPQQAGMCTVSDARGGCKHCSRKICGMLRASCSPVLRHVLCVSVDEFLIVLATAWWAVAIVVHAGGATAAAVAWA